MEIIAQARARGLDILLDAAAFVPSNRLDLSRGQPDFIQLSFYKMFGYPTGIGCLLAHKSALEKLKRPWYAGGTITNFGDVYRFLRQAESFRDGMPKDSGQFQRGRALEWPDRESP